MSSNSFGRIFRITTFGESHGPYIGAVIDGCPAGLDIDMDFIQKEMDRRRPGQSAIVSPRNEEDQVEIISGIFESKTTGTPITLLIKNKDQRPEDYELFRNAYRPSHADFTWQHKYGHRDHRGGGRSSARETAARVAAGAVAKLFLNKFDIKIIGYTSQIGEIQLGDAEIDFSILEDNDVRCPNREIAQAMIKHIREIKENGDSIGGIVSCVIKNVPVGLGDPVYEKVDALLGKAMMGINASKGFDLGSGFGAAAMKGSEHNDHFETIDGKIKPATNHAGGVLGGITSGNDIEFRVAFKPTSTIATANKLTSEKGGEIDISSLKGRHDPCIVPRAVPIVEAMAALVIADLILLNRAAKI